MGDPSVEGAEWAIRAVRAAHRRYAEGFDRGSPVAVADAFTEDGILITSAGTTVTASAGLRAFAQSWLESHPDTHTRHSCECHTVTVAPGRIEATCRATVEMVGTDGTTSVLMRATYHDTLLRTGDEWRIARRVVSADEGH